MSEIRVLMFIPGIIGGGVEQFIVNFTKYLPEDYKITVVYQHEPNEICLQKFKDSGCETIRIASKKSHPIRNFIQSYKVIKKINPHIVHSHMNQFSFIPLLLAKFKHIKVRIAHSHINEVNETGIVKIINQLGIFFTNLFCNYRFSCGKEASNYMFKSKSAIIIENGINLKRFQFNVNARKETRSNLEVDEKFVIGNIGRLTEQKNQIQLIKVFNEIIKVDNKYVLVIIGSGELENHLKQLVNQLAITNNVIFINGTNEIEKFYSAFDLFILPSLYEGFPVCAIEGQANGVPIIINNTIDSSVVFNPNVYSVDFNRKCDILAQEILNLKLERITSINKLLSVYDEESTAQKILSLYSEMLERDYS